MYSPMVQSLGFGRGDGSHVTGVEETLRRHHYTLVDINIGLKYVLCTSSLKTVFFPISTPSNGLNAQLFFEFEARKTLRTY